MQPLHGGGGLCSAVSTMLWVSLTDTLVVPSWSRMTESWWWGLGYSWGMSTTPPL